MPGTFPQIYIQIVFAVKVRENLVGNHSTPSGLDIFNNHYSIIITPPSGLDIFNNHYSIIMVPIRGWIFLIINIL